MIEIVIATLIGAVGGAITSPFMYKYLQKHLARQTSLKKYGYMRIYLPNKYVLTIWDSYLNKDHIAACCHKEGDNSVTNGDIVYFFQNQVISVEKGTK